MVIVMRARRTLACSLPGYPLEAPAGIVFDIGKLAKAAQFDNGQYAVVKGMLGVLGTYAKVTISFWLKQPGTLNSVSILDCNNRMTAPYGGIQLGLSGSQSSMCVSSTTAQFLGGNCAGFALPSPTEWHHWIIRYEGTAVAASLGGPTTVWIDGALVHTRANDGSNDPVFSPAITDALYLGTPGTQLDDVRIYDQVFTPAEQCTFLIGGTVAGTTCILP
jgi:hypothetical protein